MFEMFKPKAVKAEGSTLPKKEKRNMPDSDEVSEDDQLQPGELAEAISENYKGDWQSTSEMEQEEDLYSKQVDDNFGESDIESVGGRETKEELQREDEHRRNYNDPKSIYTQYDNLVDQSEEENVTETEKIETSFDDQADDESKKIGKEKLYGDPYRARGGNSKPVSKDHHHGLESDLDLAA